MEMSVNTPWQMGIQSASNIKFQQDAAAALLEVCSTPLEAYKVLSSTLLAQGDTLEVYESSERTPLSLKAEPFALLSESVSGWANAHLPTYPIQQSSFLGGTSGMDMVSDPRGRNCSFWQESNETVREEARVRCVRCGAQITAESQFCAYCRAPITGGLHCTVHKHASMGIAIVSLHDVQVRQAILQAGRMETIAGIKVELRPHKDKVTQEEVLTDIFVAWGHKVEKSTPLPEHKIVKFFDEKHAQFADEGQLDKISSSGEEGCGMGNKSTTCSTNSSSVEKPSDKEDVDTGDEYSTDGCGHQNEQDCQISHTTSSQSMERPSGWAAPKYVCVEQLSSLGGIGVAPLDWSKTQCRTPHAGNSSFQQGTVETLREKVGVRCFRCGEHIMTESKFCGHCGAPRTYGVHCNVRKHASMGNAIVSLPEVQVRQAILQASRVESIAGIKVKLRPHMDKVTKEEILTDIFVDWGHKVEKRTPLLKLEIAKFFDEKVVEFTNGARQREKEDEDGMVTCGTTSSLDEKVSEEESISATSEPMYIRLP